MSATAAIFPAGGLGGVSIRGARTGDHAFIYNSWLNSYAKADMVRGIARPVYYETHARFVRRVLEAGVVLVATPEADADTLLGYVARDATPVMRYEHPALHYVYVKGGVRRGGLARALLRAAGPVSAYTHKTHLGEHVVHLLGRAVYNPYCL